MIDLKVFVENNFGRVVKAVEEAKKTSFRRAAFKIMRTAQQSIEISSAPSEPGSPPHTRRKQLIRAIKYAADDEGAVIGPQHSTIGVSGHAHEFGGEYKGQDYPERPYMLPALESNEDVLAQFWEGVVTE